MTTKGERTRRHLVQVAMACFERDGFGSTTMRTIAKEAEVSVGLAYRYFDTKEGLVLAFYEDLAAELLQTPVEGETLGQRFVSMMEHKLDGLEGHRRAIGSLMGAMLDPDGPVGVLSPATATLRSRTREKLRDAVEGAGVEAHQVEALVQLAWLGHLLLLLAWVQRPAAARSLLPMVATAIDLGAPWLSSPVGSLVMMQVQGALAGFAPD